MPEHEVPEDVKRIFEELRGLSRTEILLKSFDYMVEKIKKDVDEERDEEEAEATLLSGLIHLLSSYTASYTYKVDIINIPKMVGEEVTRSAMTMYLFLSDLADEEKEKMANKGVKTGV